MSSTTPDALVDPTDLARRVSSVGGRSGVSQSIAWLTANASMLDGFGSVEDWVEETGGHGPVGHHLITVRSELALQLWQRDLLVGVTRLDELLFTAIRKRSADPVLDVLEWLSTSSLAKPTYVIYPLHSFGIVEAGLLIDRSEVDSEQLAREYGVAVSAQHNRMNQTVAWLKKVHQWFDVEGSVPTDLLEHWQRSRDSWLEKNPLLALRVHSLRGSYYENERLILDRLHVATAFLAGLTVLQPEQSHNSNSIYSSRHINNWQTLDIHHYLVMDATTDGDGAITGDAVPMGVEPGYLAELSDLPVDVRLAYWNDRADEARSLWEALETVGSLQYATRFRRRPRRKYSEVP